MEIIKFLDSTYLKTAKDVYKRQVKNIQINYSENRGTVLPGFLPGLGFWGSAKPSVGFVLGCLLYTSRCV